MIWLGLHFFKKILIPRGDKTHNRIDILRMDVMADKIIHKFAALGVATLIFKYSEGILGRIKDIKIFRV